MGSGLNSIGAHALKNRISSDMLAVFETGVRYHLTNRRLFFAIEAAGALKARQAEAVVALS